MTVMIEVFYLQPENAEREQRISDCIAPHGGTITYRESDIAGPICITIEFPNWRGAKEALRQLQRSGEHVEGPVDYGD